MFSPTTPTPTAVDVKENPLIKEELLEVIDIPNEDGVCVKDFIEDISEEEQTTSANVESMESTYREEKDLIDEEKSEKEIKGYTEKVLTFDKMEEQGGKVKRRLKQFWHFFSGFWNSVNMLEVSFSFTL